MKQTFAAERPQTSPTAPGFDLLAVFALLIVSLAIAWPRWRCGIDWGDEGFLAYGAVRVSEGQMPNRDFVSLQPPLSFYTAALIYKIFGTSLLSLRCYGLALYLIIPVLVYGIARYVAKPIAAFAAAIPLSVLGLPYFYFAPLAMWQGITASLAAALCYLHAIFRGHRWAAGAAGILTAASILLRHDQGLYLFIAILAFTVAVKRAQREPALTNKTTTVLLWWQAGMSIVILPSIVYWWVASAIPAMFQQLIVFPLVVYGKTSSLPFRLFSAQLPFSRNGVIALYYLPPIVILSSVVWLIWYSRRHGFAVREAVLTFFIIWSVLFYFQVLTRTDNFHLFITLPPLFILIAGVASALAQTIGSSTSSSAGRSGSANTRSMAVSAVTTLLVVFFLWTIAPACLPNVTKAREILPLKRGGVRVEHAAEVARFVEAVQNSAPPNRSILSLPYQPMFYFLCERRNPTHWNYIWPGDQTAEDHAALIAQAKQDPPAAVFIAGEKTMNAYAPAILGYVHAEYQAAGTSGGVTFYLPR